MANERFQLVAITFLSFGDHLRIIPNGGQNAFGDREICGGRFLRGAKRFAISEDFSKAISLGRQSGFRFSGDGSRAYLSGGKWVFVFRRPFSRWPRRFSSVGDRSRAISVGG